jgi:hypothetical protein
MKLTAVFRKGMAGILMLKLRFPLEKIHGCTF